MLSEDEAEFEAINAIKNCALKLFIQKNVAIYNKSCNQINISSLKDNEKELFRNTHTMFFF